MQLTAGPLQWPTTPTDPPSGTDPDAWASALAVAVDVLWSRSGRQFGTRACTYRPQALWISAGYWDALPILAGLYGSLWGLMGAPWSGYRPNVPDPRVLELPRPAVSVSQVQTVAADGTVTVLPTTAYRLDGDFLVRTDGSGWPTTQDLIASEPAANTWHVSYVRGNTVPVAGQVAAYLLALQILKAGDKTCTLPYNTTTVSRAGVTINRDALKAAKTTGVEAADRWLEAVNPQGLQQPPAVWSPDLPRNGRPYAGSTLPLT